MASTNELPQQVPTEDYGGFQLFAPANIWITACLTNSTNVASHVVFTPHDSFSIRLEAVV
jgi:hypothetical protein